MTAFENVHENAAAVKLRKTKPLSTKSFMKTWSGQVGNHLSVSLPIVQQPNPQKLTMFLFYGQSTCFLVLVLVIINCLFTSGARILRHRRWTEVPLTYGAHIHSSRRWWSIPIGQVLCSGSCATSFLQGGHG